MRLPRRIGICVLLGVAVLVLFVVCQSREPVYQGRTLTSWLEQCSDTPLMETEQLSHAQQAVRAIGAGKALPFLLRKARASDGRLRSWLLNQNERLGSHSFKLRTAEETQELAIVGFEALGTNCAPAIPELNRMLDDPNHAFAAARCLLCIGKPAEASICRALTNMDWRVRQFAVSQLAWVIDDVEVYLARLKDCLKDTNSAVRFAVVQGVGVQTHEPDSAIPLLLAALQDPDDNIRSLAAKSLAGFGTNALRATSALTNAAASPKPVVASAALRTLVAIAPAESLPLVLDHFRSGAPSRRRQAFALLCAYPFTNSEIQSAIDLAATDSDAIISRKAKLLLTEQYRKNHSDEWPGADDPSYAGKSLGEWLKRRADGNLSPEAQVAIRYMGTNAIPALLDRLVYTEPPFGLRATETNLQAMAAFLVLGEQAKSALPKLRVIMNGEDEHQALFALIAACRMGVDALPSLLGGLTNKHANVRREAVGLLTADPGAKLPQLGKLAVPVLIQLLRDPDESVRMNATNALKEIDPAAAAAAGVK